MQITIAWRHVLASVALCGLGAAAGVTGSWVSGEVSPPTPLGFAVHQRCTGFSLFTTSMADFTRSLKDLEARRLRGELRIPNAAPTGCTSWSMYEVQLSPPVPAFRPPADPAAQERAALNRVVGSGKSIEERYAALANCLSMPVPDRLPTVVIRPRTYVPCHGEPGGQCDGTFSPRRRVVSLAYGSFHALQHEFLHDLLCQRGDCDRDHTDEAWSRCIKLGRG